MAGEFGLDLYFFLLQKNYLNIYTFFQEKVALEIPNSLPLKNWLGTMNVLFVAFVTNLWLEKDLFKKRVALFAQSVLEKKCWRRWRLKIRNKFFPR